MTYPERLLSSFRELSHLVLSRETVGSTLDVVSNLAVQTIPGCDVACVSLVSPDEIKTVGASHDVAFTLDDMQYETGQGPCLDAIGKDAMWFRIEDMGRDTTWPAFSARAKQEGFNSQLAFTLQIGDNTLGALNLYSRQTAAFAEDDVDNGAIFAAHAAVALSRAQASGPEAAQLEDLDEALVAQEIIARAVGILMGRELRGPEDAFQVLEERAQELKVKLVESARSVVVAADSERADMELPPGFADRIMGRANDN